MVRPQKPSREEQAINCVAASGRQQITSNRNAIEARDRLK
jgi:hypothetical protein